MRLAVNRLISRELCKCKQSQGKLEKAEIMEMAVRYIKAVQTTEIGLRLEHGRQLFDLI